MAQNQDSQNLNRDQKSGKSMNSGKDKEKSFNNPSTDKSKEQGRDSQNRDSQNRERNQGENQGDRQSPKKPVSRDI